MSEQQTINSPQSSRAFEFDREKAYGEFLRTSRWKDETNRRYTLKALDLPEEDVIQANRTQIGITWREIVAIGALCGGGMGLFSVLNRPAAVAPIAPSTPPAAVAPIVAPELEPIRGKIRFWIEDDNVQIGESQ